MWNLIEEPDSNGYKIIITPIVNRGITQREKKEVISSILVKSTLPREIESKIKDEGQFLNIEGDFVERINFSTYEKDNMVEDNETDNP